MSVELDAVIAEQRLSDSVYEIFTTELGSTMEQAEIASRDRQLLKQFKTSSGGAVLMFQNKPIMRHDHGEPIKAYLKATKLDFLLPPATPDPIKSLDIPEATLNLAKSGNLTAKAAVYQIVHGSKSKSEEVASLATVEALIAGDTLTEPVLDNQMDDRTRRASRAADTDQANNPWSEKAWSITNQGKKIKEIGLEAAAGIAASAHSHIGATHPTKRT